MLKISKNLEHKIFKKYQPIFDYGDQGNHLYYVLKGKQIIKIKF
jgi:CRP-like cAMP-binding protein